MKQKWSYQRCPDDPGGRVNLASRGDGKSVGDSTRCLRSLTRGIVPTVAVAFLVAVAVVLSVALAAAPFLFLSFFVPV